MQDAKGVILAQKFALGRLLKWFTVAAAIPSFGIVAAFGVAPDTLSDRVEVARVVQEIALPTPVLLDGASDANFIQEDRVETRRYDRRLARTAQGRRSRGDRISATGQGGTAIHTATHRPHRPRRDLAGR